MAGTLADRVKDFSSIKLKKASVKVPRLRVRNKIIARNRRSKKEISIPVSSIVSILLKAALEDAKREEKEPKEEDNSKAAAKKEEQIIHGGYGTATRHYGITHSASYADYGKLFSHIGKFRSQSAYENFVSETPSESINRIMEQGNRFYLLDREVIDSGVRSIKYFTNGVLTGEPAAVPMGGINSADWEKFKLWKIVDYVMFNLKMQTL